MSAHPVPPKDGSGTRPQKKNAAVDIVPPVLLTIEEAARALRISKRMLWQLTKDGSIKCKKVGKLVRYRRHDIEAWSEES